MMRTQQLAGLVVLPLAVALVAMSPRAAAAAEDGEIVVVLSEEPDIIDPCEASRSNVGRIV
jgi:peptide/nickel transport system substrate-binding protein